MIRALLALAWLCGSAAAAPLSMPYVPQPTAVTCLPAAAAMSLAAQGLPISVDGLARSLPVHADGISALDLQDAITALGGHAWLARGDRALLHRLLAAGAPPVLLVSGGQKHAIVVHGQEEGSWAVRDPSRPALTHLTDEELEALWAPTGYQVLVVFVRSWTDEALPREVRRSLEAQSRRFRAVEWMLRARSHGAPTDQAMSLYDRALAEDDALPELHTDVGIAWCRRGDLERARAHLQRAADLRPGDRAAATNLERLLSGRAACAAGPSGSDFLPPGQ